MTILAATRWASNAELIHDCFRLGYLQEDWLILDPTWGRGTWWKTWQPKRLVTLNRDKDGSDFRQVDFPDQTFDAIAFDPPFVCAGGRKTTGLPDMHARYGMADAPTSPAALQVLMNDGMDEMTRVLKAGGILLMKNQDYVSSGKLWIGTHYTLSHGIGLGLELIDRLEHIGHPRPQPDGRQQKHARRNLSTLFVFRKGLK